jgi:septal ring factor EnvC (AmiA/AmiB activator)
MEENRLENYSLQIKDLQNKINKLGENNNHLEGEITNLKQNIAQLNDDIIIHQDEIEYYEKQIEEINEDKNKNNGETNGEEDNLITHKTTQSEGGCDRDLNLIYDNLQYLLRNIHYRME